MDHRSKWTELVEADPGHSKRYVRRFRDLAAAGEDIFGEARLIDAMLPRGARVLDAGCGAGRTGGFLARVGHTVVGVDQDPVLIRAAEEDFPGATWLVGDLAELDLPARGIGAGFDAIVCAGNVLTFLHPATRVPVSQGGETRQGDPLGEHRPSVRRRRRPGHRQVVQGQVAAGTEPGQLVGGEPERPEQPAQLEDPLHPPEQRLDAGRRVHGGDRGDGRGRHR